MARLKTPGFLAVGPDGSLYISDTADQRIRRVGPDGIITTVAGTGSAGYGGGGPATHVFAALNYPQGIAVSPDGTLYIADRYNYRVRRVGTDGIMTNVAGTGFASASGDGGPALQADLIPTNVAVGSDGSLYIAEAANYRIRRVGVDGIITTVVGTGTAGFGGDGGPATAAQLSFPCAVVQAPDGSLYVADSDNNRVRRVGPDGIITTVAGMGTPGIGGDGGPASEAALNFPVGLAFGTDGKLYFAEAGYSDGVGGHRVRRLEADMPGFSLTDFLVPAEDGSEVYVFNAAGRHLRTVDALTGGLRYGFGYDAAGRLSTITDGSGNRTSVERDSTGAPLALVAPGGQRTTLAANADGYIEAVANPAGETTLLRYTSDGLLTDLTDPRSNRSAFRYDERGRLQRDDDPAGGFQSLARTDDATSYTVTRPTSSTSAAPTATERGRPDSVRRTT